MFHALKSFSVCLSSEESFNTYHPSDLSSPIVTPDYWITYYNSTALSFTALSFTLRATQRADNAILVTIDVDSFYPSIPQTECMNIIYDNMHKNRHQRNNNTTSILPRIFRLGGAKIIMK